MWKPGKVRDGRKKILSMKSIISSLRDKGRRDGRVWKRGGERQKEQERDRKRERGREGWMEWV